MVIGASNRDHFADAEGRKVARVGTFELSRVVDRTYADDDALARHQPRDRLHGSDSSRVREADVRTLEVLNGELVPLNFADDFLIRRKKPIKIEKVAVAQNWDQQRATAVILLHVDGETHVDVVVHDKARLAVFAQDVSVLHRWDGVGDGPHDRPTDQMGKANFRLTRTGPETVDDLAVDLKQLGWDVAEAGSCRHRKACLHIASNGCARTADRFSRLFNRLGTCWCTIGNRWRRRRKRFGLNAMYLGIGLDLGRCSSGSGHARGLGVVIREKLLP